jgi:hypothetical protein
VDCSSASLARKIAAFAAEPNSPKSLNAFVHIGTRRRRHFTIHKPENGQGTTTSLAQLLAEELEVDWKKVRWEYAPINPVYAKWGYRNRREPGDSNHIQPLRQAGRRSRDAGFRPQRSNGVSINLSAARENSTVIIP